MSFSSRSYTRRRLEIVTEAVSTSTSSGSSSHQKYGMLTRPTMYEYNCKTGKHKFLSSLSKESLAHNYHNRSCPHIFAIQDRSAPVIESIDYDPHYPDDIHYLMFDENSDGELIDEDNDLDHIDFCTIGLDPELNYGLVEISEAIHSVFDRYDELEDPIPVRISAPPSTIFVHLQEHIEELYSIDCFKDTLKFSLRFGVMWQDVLSLYNFSLKNHMTRSSGMELIELIHEIMRRHGCDAIPLHRKWDSVEKCIGRKLQPTNSV